MTEYRSWKFACRVMKVVWDVALCFIVGALAGVGLFYLFEQVL